MKETLVQYEAKFGDIPMPMCVPLVVIEGVLREHLELDIPVPDDYDWHPDVPKDAII